MHCTPPASILCQCKFAPLIIAAVGLPAATQKNADQWPRRIVNCELCLPCSYLAMHCSHSDGHGCTPLCSNQDVRTHGHTAEARPALGRGQFEAPLLVRPCPVLLQDASGTPPKPPCGAKVVWANNMRRCSLKIVQYIRQLATLSKHWAALR